jgi:hypothetical protein
LNKLVDTILVGVSTIGILLFLRHFIATQIVLWSVVMLGVGLFVLLFAGKLLDGEPSRIKSFFINTLGLTLLIGGANFILEHFTNQYWWVYGIVGIIIFEFHSSISERL